MIHAPAGLCRSRRKENPDRRRAPALRFASRIIHVNIDHSVTTDRIQSASADHDTMIPNHYLLTADDELSKEILFPK